jgi:hypothetical protein
MTTAVTFNPTKLPAFARKREGGKSALTKALAGNTTSGYGRKISIRGGVFRLISDGKEVAAIEDRYLDVVIVNAAETISRVFYEGKFSEEENTGPSCRSANGEKPDADITNPPSQTCNNCPNNIKGSGQGESRACRFNQRIAVVLANDMDGDVLQLVVPAKSLFGKESNSNFPLQAYARWLSAQSIEPNEVITRIKFDTTESSPKLFFKTMRWLEDSEFATCDAKGQSEDAKKAVEPLSGTASPAKPQVAQIEDFSSDDEEAPPPPVAKKKAKPKAEQVEEAEEAEPSVRKQAEAPTLPPRKSLASIADQWDTDD